LLPFSNVHFWLDREVVFSTVVVDECSGLHDIFLSSYCYRYFFM
jgi:hypothetical protein